MEYIFVLAAIVAGLHACSFAKWLWGKKNWPGAVIVVVLVLFSLGIPAYRLLTAP